MSKSELGPTFESLHSNQIFSLAMSKSKSELKSDFRVAALKSDTSLGNDEAWHNCGSTQDIPDSVIRCSNDKNPLGQ